MRVYFDPLNPECKSVTGGIKEDEKLKLKIFCDGNVCTVNLIEDGGENISVPLLKKRGAFECTLSLKKGLYFYLFEIDGATVGRDDKNFAKIGSEERFQLSVVDRGYEYPIKRKGGTVYQVFPDRFARKEGYGKHDGKKMRKWGDTPVYLPNENGKITNDDFFGGNFEGIRQKLPYLKELGVTCIYLNPIVKAFSNHRYDTGDYLAFDELLGDEEDFKRLTLSALKQGIRIIFDGVFNHVGADSVYFNKYGNYSSKGAYNDKNSEYADWFTFKDYPDDYISWWGIETLPTVKRGAKGFEDLILGDNGVLSRYFSLGVSGVRLDVVDELSDDFIKKINDKVKSYGKGNIVIGEVWEDATNKIAYGERKKYFLNGELDGVMNYPLRSGIIDYVLSGKSDIIYGVVREQIDHYPKDALDLLMNVLGTHDTPRIITVLGKSGNLATERVFMADEFLTEEEYILGKKRLKCASLLQFTLYGVPSVYYGDEVGMEGNKDPFNRRCFIPENGDEEIKEWYKFLGGLRKNSDCFKDGEAVFIKAKDGLFSYSRTGKTSTVTVVVNCGDKAETISLKEEASEITRKIKTSKITLGKYDFAVFYKAE